MKQARVALGAAILLCLMLVAASCNETQHGTSSPSAPANASPTSPTPSSEPGQEIDYSTLLPQGAASIEVICKSCRSECPVMLAVTDPEGITIDSGERDIDGDGRLDIQAWTENTKPGIYKIEITAKPWASPTDTFSLIVSPMEHKFGYTPITLAGDIAISDIPPAPYLFQFKDRKETTITYMGPHNGYHKDTVKLTAVLTDGDGNPIGDKTVTFDFSGRVISAVTAGDGTASASLTLLQEPSEHYIINPRFNGDVDYLPSDYVSVEFEVLPPRAKTKSSGVWTNYVMEAGVWTTLNTYNEDVRPTPVAAIAIDRNGDIWFAHEGGVTRFNGTEWTIYTKENGLGGNSVLDISIDNSGDKWFLTENGITKFNGSNWTTYVTWDPQEFFISLYYSNENRFGMTLPVMAVDKGGNVWIGTRAGVRKYDGTNWVTYSTENGLAGNNVLAIDIDNKNNVWVGTDCGASVFDGTNWTATPKKMVSMDILYLLSQLTIKEMCGLALTAV